MVILLWCLIGCIMMIPVSMTIDWHKRGLKLYPLILVYTVAIALVSVILL